MRQKGLFVLIILMLTVALYGCKGDKNGNENQTTPAADSDTGSPTYGGSVIVGG